MTSAVTKRPDSRLASRRLRKAVLFLHLCIGLVLGLYFSLLGLTGSALIFKSELHRFFKPSLYYVVPPENSSRLSLDKLAQVFKDNHPDISIASLGLPVVASDVLIVGYRAPEPGQKKGQSMQALIDPYTGKVITEQLSGGWFFRTLHNLHAKLLLDDLGEDIHRYGVLAIFALLLSGFLLGPKIKIKFDGTFNRKIFDVHNVVGFFAGGVLFVLALTASSDLWHEQALAIVGGLTGGPAEAEKKAVEANKKGPPPSYDAMLATARSALPNMVAVAITDKFGVRMVSPEDSYVVPYVVPRCVTVFFNKSDARLLRVEDPVKLPLGQQIMAWLLPIHFGQWGPGISYYFVKAIWFVAGLCPSILFGSAVMMFLLKHGSKRNSGLERNLGLDQSSF